MPGNEPLARQALAFVPAGGRGSRLLELTDRRAKPAVYFGGKSAHHRFRAVERGELRHPPHRGRHPVQGAQPDPASCRWAGTSSAPSATRASTSCPPASAFRRSCGMSARPTPIYQNIDIIESHNARFIVVLAGDHIYKMDYEVMLRQHVDSGADVTVGCLEMPRAESSGFGIMHIDENGWIQEFLEKPHDPPPMPGKPDVSLASMGIYVFDAEIPVRPAQARRRGSELEPRFRPGHHSLYRQERPRHRRTSSRPPASAPARPAAPTGATSARSTPIGPPTSISRPWCRSSTCSTAPGRSGPMPRSRRPQSSCMTRRAGAARRCPRSVSGGCIISGASLRRSLLFTGVRINSYANVENAVIMPYVECRARRAAEERRDRPRRRNPGRARRRRGSRESMRSAIA